MKLERREIKYFVYFVVEKKVSFPGNTHYLYQRYFLNLLDKEELVLRKKQ